MRNLIIASFLTILVGVARSVSVQSISLLIAGILGAAFLNTLLQIYASSIHYRREYSGLYCKKTLTPFGNFISLLGLAIGLSVWVGPFLAWFRVFP